MNGRRESVCRARSFVHVRVKRQRLSSALHRDSSQTIASSQTAQLDIITSGMDGGGAGGGGTYSEVGRDFPGVSKLPKQYPELSGKLINFPRMREGGEMAQPGRVFKDGSDASMCPAMT